LLDIHSGEVSFANPLPYSEKAFYNATTLPYPSLEEFITMRKSLFCVFAISIAFVNFNISAKEQQEVGKHVSVSTAAPQQRPNDKLYHCTGDATIQVLGVAKQADPCKAVSAGFGTFGSASFTSVYVLSNKARMGEVTEEDVTRFLRRGGLSEEMARTNAKPIFKGLRSGEFKALTGVAALGGDVFAVWETYSALKDSAPK